MKIHYVLCLLLLGCSEGITEFKTPSGECGFIIQCNSLKDCEEDVIQVCNKFDKISNVISLRKESEYKFTSKFICE